MRCDRVSIESVSENDKYKKFRLFMNEKDPKTMFLKTMIIRTFTPPPPTDLHFPNDIDKDQDIFLP